ncbi:MAG: RluA family pseudouridine synthase [Lachnospiraceae bacterium]|nr:RluA family pseudouridine synthase [Lachnospiraceae bacterium]
MSNQDNIRLFNIDAEEQCIRLDKFLSQSIEDFSRSFLRLMIDNNEVMVNDKPVKASYNLKIGDVVKLQFPVIKEPEIKPENIPLDILYEDDDIIVINKQKGLVVHPAPGHFNGTLVNALLYHCKDSLSGINGVMRPGIVHRIDKDTTGVIVACKNDNSHKFIAEQLKVHSITREYVCIVKGHVKNPEGTIDVVIGRSTSDRKKMAVNVKNGKHAVTHYKVLEYPDHNHTYVSCTLETGRTHQIRVSMASIGYPLLGDLVYGKSKQKYETEGQVLHARKLGFIHPTTKEYMEFTAPLPEYFQKILDTIRNEKKNMN